MNSSLGKNLAIRMMESLTYTVRRTSQPLELQFLNHPKWQILNGLSQPSLIHLTSPLNKKPNQHPRQQINFKKKKKTSHPCQVLLQNSHRDKKMRARRN